MKDQATKDSFIAMRAGGISFAAIAKKLHVSKQTLIEWSRECAEKIDNLREIEAEALRERYRATMAARLELVGGLEERIATELKGRKLKNVSTERLAALLLKCHEIMATLVAPVKFRATHKYSLAESLSLDNQSATAEWEG